MVIRKSITDLKTLKRGALNAKPKLLRISDATFARLFPSLTCKKVPQDTMCTPMVTRTTTNTYYVFIISTFHNKLMKLCSFLMLTANVDLLINSLNCEHHFSRDATPLRSQPICLLLIHISFSLKFENVKHFTNAFFSGAPKMRTH